MQKNPQADLRQESSKEAKDGTGGLVQLMEMTKTLHDGGGLQKASWEDRGFELWSSPLPQAEWNVEGSFT